MLLRLLTVRLLRRLTTTNGTSSDFILGGCYTPGWVCGCTVVTVSEIVIDVPEIGTQPTDFSCARLTVPRIDNNTSSQQCDRHRRNPLKELHSLSAIHNLIEGLGMIMKTCGELATSKPLTYSDHTSRILRTWRAISIGTGYSRLRVVISKRDRLLTIS